MRGLSKVPRNYYGHVQKTKQAFWRGVMCKYVLQEHLGHLTGDWVHSYFSQASSLWFSPNFLHRIARSLEKKHPGSWTPLPQSDTTMALSGNSWGVLEIQASFLAGSYKNDDSIWEYIASKKGFDIWGMCYITGTPRFGYSPLHINEGIDNYMIQGSQELLSPQCGQA